MKTYFLANLNPNGSPLTSALGTPLVDQAQQIWEYLHQQAPLTTRIVWVEIDEQGNSKTVRNEVKS